MGKIVAWAAFVVGVWLTFVLADALAGIDLVGLVLAFGLLVILPVSVLVAIRRWL
jgi:hypothetical protein